MKKLFVKGVVAFFFACASAAFVASAQETAGSVTGGAARPAQQRVLGEVTAIDPSGGQVTVRTDAGETVTVSTDARTEYFRVAPGQTSLEGAEKLTRADLRVGDRVVTRGAAGQAARQVIVTTRAAAAGEGAAQTDGRRRLVGRVLSLDASKKEIAVQTFSRGGAETVTLGAGEGVRLLRFAPDSLRPADARPGTFADLRVGDQLRATGQRAADGGRFTAEEIVSGSFARLAGSVTAVDAARGEFTVNDQMTGQTFTVATGRNTSLRRATPEFVEILERRGRRGGQGGGARNNDPEAQARREERRRQREAAGGQGSAGQGEREGRGPGEGRGQGEREGRGPGGERRGGGMGRGPQQMFEALPVVTVGDLKKGDTVLVTATPGADASRVTAVALVAGDADFLQRLTRSNADPRNMSPGLPGDVIGGGVGTRQEPPGNPN